MLKIAKPASKAAPKASPKAAPKAAHAKAATKAAKADEDMIGIGFDSLDGELSVAERFRKAVHGQPAARRLALEEDFVFGRAWRDLMSVRQMGAKAARVYLDKFIREPAAKRPEDVKAALNRARSAKSTYLKRWGLQSANAAKGGRGGRPKSKATAPKTSEIPAPARLIAAHSAEAAEAAKAVPVVSSAASVAEWAARELVALARVQAQAAQRRAWKASLGAPYAALMAALKTFEAAARAAASEEAARAEARDEPADAAQKPQTSGKTHTTRGK